MAQQLQIASPEDSNTDPFFIQVSLAKQALQAMVDTGCLCTAAISLSTASALRLPRFQLPQPLRLKVAKNIPAGLITHFIAQQLVVQGHSQLLFAYVVPDLSYPFILGLPWLKRASAKISFTPDSIVLSLPGQRQPAPTQPPATQQPRPAFYRPFLNSLAMRVVEIAKLTAENLSKALQPKALPDAAKLVPKAYHRFLHLFQPPQQLPPYRPGFDHEIRLEKQPDGQEKPLPASRHYPMSAAELLLLRKDLDKLLANKKIRPSSSPAAAPTLYVGKPGGGARLCVDYTRLNQISQKDRYPLPLIKDLFRMVSTATHLTTIDLTSAFHQNRMKKGEEYKTAFITPWGLFEWLVTPFGLSGAPSSFQRLINHILRPHQAYCMAYMDDIIIFSSGTLKHHQQLVLNVLKTLQSHQIHLDPQKSQFNTPSVKYLGFILTAGKSAQMDPSKVAEIAGLQPPASVKELQHFLGVCNYYRGFIKDFSKLTTPLTLLLRQDAPKPFALTPEASDAFQQLIQAFQQQPVLSLFNPALPTTLQADSSGFALGGVLSQQQADKAFHPVAFYSRKLSDAEQNYTIYDKELLAIIACLKEWYPEVRNLENALLIQTDHKNLTYFSQPQILSERQIRWLEFLGQIRFRLCYLPGRQNTIADFLSRQQKHMPPAGSQRPPQALLPACLWQSAAPATLTAPLAAYATPAISAAPIATTNPATLPSPFQDPPLANLWKQALQDDFQYQQALQAVQSNQKTWPPGSPPAISISECDLDPMGRLRFRERLWIPCSEPLQTQLIQQVHDSALAGHPGEGVTYSLLARQFYWPGASQAVKRFVRNCRTCGKSAIWRDKSHGLLKPLPIPSRPWSEISWDFISPLPPSPIPYPATKSLATSILVITDRLTKGCILIPMEKTTSPAVASAFYTFFVPYHGLPSAIVSDRGSQFTSTTWAVVCSLLGIQRRLSTAFHPQTDGATERMNIQVEAYLQAFCSLGQDNWATLLPAATLAINNKPSALKVSPFFLNHGYDLEALPVTPLAPAKPQDPEQLGQQIASQLQQGYQYAQAAMALAQQTMEKQSNRRRQPAPQYQPGDQVWLKLKNITSLRPSKKLDWRNHLYTILEAMGTHAYKLNTPPGIHPVFHTSLLRPAAQDPLPSQVQQDNRPPPVLVDGHEEWEVEEVLRLRQNQALVKWVGYPQPDWQPLSNIKDTTAFAVFERRRKEGASVTG